MSVRPEHLRDDLNKTEPPGQPVRITVRVHVVVTVTNVVTVVVAVMVVVGAHKASPGTLPVRDDLCEDATV
ncbi:MAG: hypothetical protein J2P58_12400 [Acidimicrobiaceae bacterium]|nr:hypothetical protein [Acidimicrobiaceae bacterium]